MTYRDDLATAHARIEALEAELERLKAAYTGVVRRNDELEADARVGRAARIKREEPIPFDELIFAPPTRKNS